MKVASLCSGYGGLEMGVALVEPVEVIWHAEVEDAPALVHAHHWPATPNVGDIKAADWASLERPDLLTAGYPCQPFSTAGRRQGADDDRHLWPFVADAVRVLRPGRVLLENVAGHLSLGFDVVLADLAALGYDARWGCVRAADAGAPHRRERVFIVATDPGGAGAGWEPRAVPRAAGEGRRADLDVRPTGDDQRAAPDPEDLGHDRARRARGRGPGPADDGGPAADSAGEGRGPHEGRGRGTVPGPEVAGRPAGEPGRRCRGGAGQRPVAAADAHGERLAGWTEPDERTIEPGQPAPRRADADRLGAPPIEWGPFEPAVRRWEHLTRPAPAPTDDRGRLSPLFVEWMMGLPDGWVTGLVRHTVRLPRSAQLKMLGNGVVPQAAALAWRALTCQAVAS